MVDYLVLYGEQRKILSASGYQDLVKNVCNSFKLNGDPILQVYSDVWEEFVDIDGEVLPDGGRIKVVLKPVSNFADYGNGVEAASSPASTEKENIASDIRATCFSNPSRKLPLPFNIPTDKFGKSLIIALTAQRDLTSSEQNGIVDILYEEITRYTFYPKPYEYTEVVNSLLNKYSHLRKIRIGDAELVGDDSLRKWKNKISDKFRNMRKRREHNYIPEVAAMKRGKIASKEQTENVTNPASAAAKNYWGLKNYNPTLPNTEDATTIKKNKEWLQRESKRRTMDMKSVRIKMDLSFSDRRKLIIDELASVAKVMDEYPCLFNEEEIIHEFERLTEKSMDQAFMKGLTFYTKPLLEMVGSKGKHFADMQRNLDEAQTPNEKARMKAVAALLAVPDLLKEKAAFVVDKKKKPDKITNPVIIHNGNLFEKDTSFEIFAEDILIAEPLDFTQAVECLLATYYVFNMMYPKDSDMTLQFYQRCLLNLLDKSSTPRRLVSLMVKLGSRKD